MRTPLPDHDLPRPSYHEHPPAAPHSPHQDHIAYSHDFFNIPPPDHGLGPAPIHHVHFPGPDRQPYPHWQHHPPPDNHHDLRGPDPLAVSPPDPELQKRTAALIAMNDPQMPSHMPTPPAAYHPAPVPEQPPPDYLYRGAAVGVAPQFQSRPPAGFGGFMSPFGQSHPEPALSYPSLGFSRYHPVPVLPPPPQPKPSAVPEQPRPAPSKRTPDEIRPPPPTKRTKRSPNAEGTSGNGPSPTLSSNNATPRSATSSAQPPPSNSMPPPAPKRPVALLSADQKKANHIHSEQKRRATIRKGYEALCEVVPSLREVVAAGGPGVGAVNAGVSWPEEEVKPKKKTKAKGKGKKDKDDDESSGGLGGVVKSEALVLSKTIDYLEELLKEREQLVNEHRGLVHMLPSPPPLPPPPSASGARSAQYSEHPGARELRCWEEPWQGGTGMPPPHMRDAMVWMKGLDGSDDDDDDDDANDDDNSGDERS